MCGICGYINLDKAPIPDEKILKAMTDALVHRGPDDEGRHIKDNVALGHRRLSIIDLKTGHQPIFSAAGRLTIVYNGEVYNFPQLKEELLAKGHSFSTHSDTEVVLKAYEEWGSDCLNRLNGMFSLAIWDAQEKALFLARDRFGKKPLYYGRFKNTFIFGSELKALYRHPAVSLEVDRLALGKYLAHDYIPCPRTIIKGISKLEPGHYLVVKNGEAAKRKYWDFRFDIGPSARRSLEESARMLVELLRESVRKRLVSDVPLGVFLSGGIDSSAVVAMMARLMDPKDIKTFSIGFKEKTYNEADDALLVARHFKTDHREKIIDPKAMLEVLPTILNTIDEPFADSSIIPTYLVSKFTRERVTVALGGDGGDELFMGYPSFVAHRIAGYYDKLPRIGRRAMALAADMAPGKSNYMSLHFKMSRFLKGIDFPESIRHQVWIGSFSPEEQRSLFADTSDETLFDPHAIYSESEAYFDTYPLLSTMDKVEYLYIKTYLPDDILTKVDRASMATSLEVRAPFLDKEIADFAGTVPNRLKLKGLTTKYILKKALEGILPRRIVHKTKHGFAVPVGDWFKSELKGLLLDTFNKTAVTRDGIFNYPAIERLLNGHFTGKTDSGRKIWALFVCQMWYNKWVKKQ
ncbi:MAG: asparagine synthase (glutamine-hydrolyzing) [Candidatus Omnitrophica bacterium]|nr:asparagine synthase (glutamine-hydrolyzing) [Candidatus Omnitrophota bacterium]